jgi:hypothetical protein
MERYLTVFQKTAIKYTNIEILKYLIQYGCSPEAFKYAVKLDKLEYVKLLANNQSHYTINRAITIAFKNNYITIVTYLASLGGIIDCDSDYDTDLSL